MKIFDPVTEFDECLAAINTFMENHRIEPYTPEEIAEIMKPAERIATIKLAPYEEYQNETT